MQKIIYYINNSLCSISLVPGCEKKDQKTYSHAEQMTSSHCGI